MRSRAARLALFGCLSAATLTPAGYSRTAAARDIFNTGGARVPAARISRVQAALRKLDDRIAILLAKQTGSASPREAGISARVNYCIIIRHLYKVANHNRADFIRAPAVLKADILEHGAPAFDKMIKSLAKNHAPPGRAKAWQAVLSFNTKASMPETGNNDTSSYLKRMLVPLTPVYLWLTRKKPHFDVWPRGAAKRKVPTSRPALPPISQTNRALQTANIADSMRAAMRNALAGIRLAMAKKTTRPAARAYYRLLLQSLDVAKTLNRGGALSSEAANRLSHQLLVGLMLFRDTRTRQAAIKRLNAVAMVAGIVREVQTSALPISARRALVAPLHAAVMEQRNPLTAAQGLTMLRSLGSFVDAYDAYANVAKATVPPDLNVPFKRIVATGKKVLGRVVARERHGITADALTSHAGDLDQIAGNLRRLAAMESAIKLARKFHPLPFNGVRLKMTRWSRSIAKHPLRRSAGAVGFDQFQTALATLVRARAALPANVSPALRQKLSRGRYARFVRAFLRRQRALINALATRRGAPGSFIQELDDERNVLLTTAALGEIEQNTAGLEALNHWPLWQLSPPARRKVMRALARGLGRKYQTETHARVHARPAKPGANGRSVPRSPRVPFAVAAPAARKLATLYVAIVGRISAANLGWAATFARVLEPPPPGSPYVRAGLSTAVACMNLNAAIYNYRHGNRGIAAQILTAGLRSLAQAPIPPFTNAMH